MGEFGFKVSKLMSTDNTSKAVFNKNFKKITIEIKQFLQ